MPFGIQPIHLIIVAIVALLIFGPARLPEIGRGVGKALNEFRRSAKEMGGSFIEEINQTDATNNQSDTTQTFTAAVPVNLPSTPTTKQVSQGNFCIHCGNPPGAIYCNQCGSKIAE
jgi:sec-independent protein translocase protein TatA